MEVGIERQLEQAMAVGERLLNRDKAGRYLGVSRRSLDELIASGQLRPIKLPGIVRTLIDRVDLDQMIDRLKE